MFQHLAVCCLTICLCGTRTMAARTAASNCHTNPELKCLHGGTCKNPNKKSPNFYKCHCLSQYCGKQCQADNPCYKTSLCRNDGRCSCFGQEKVDYFCSCPSPFTGKNCETLPAKFDPCSYPNDCPESTTCEPGFYHQSLKKGSKTYVRVLVYNCKVSLEKGYYYLKKHLRPHSSAPQEPTRSHAKRQRCKEDERDKDCSKELKLDNYVITVTPQSITKIKMKPDGDQSICGKSNSYNQKSNTIDGFEVSDTGDVTSHEDTNKDSFDDIDTSAVNTSDIDYIIFGQDTRRIKKWIFNQSLREGVTFHKRNVEKEVLRESRKKRKHSKSVSSNPCKHGAQCIPLKRNRYTCLCPKGTKGKNCSEGCPQGRYRPPQCKQTCGQCSADTCNYKSGVCDGKCLPGWRGRLCKLRNSLTLFMRTKLSGLFHKDFSVTSSPKYLKIKSTLNSWITSLCDNSIKLPCSVADLKILKGSIILSYKVLFDFDASLSRDSDISQDLVKTLKRNVDQFNSTDYQVMRESLEVTQVKRNASVKTTIRRKKWWLIGGIAVSAGLVIVSVLILAIALPYFRSRKELCQAKL